jgi:type III pantothenate kinase
MNVAPFSPPVLALDIGNTRTKAGLIDVRRCIYIASTSLPTAEVTSRLLPAVNELAASSAVPVTTTAVLSSVVRSAGTIAANLLRSAGYTVRHLTATDPLPLTIAYDSPRTLGADRIANALFGTTLFPGRAVIIVSAGTAITIDYIADRTFYGGAILPGIGLQLQSLHHSTDALPGVGSDTTEVPSLPGSSTENCILGGVLHGTAAAISGIIAAYRKRTAPRRPLILTTGGDWQVLSRLVDFKCRTIPDLTLIGAACSLKY